MVVYLPPYSPDCSPIEKMFNLEVNTELSAATVFETYSLIVKELRLHPKLHSNCVKVVNSSDECRKGLGYSIMLNLIELVV